MLTLHWEEWSREEGQEQQPRRRHAFLQWLLCHTKAWSDTASGWKGGQVVFRQAVWKTISQNNTSTGGIERKTPSCLLFPVYQTNPMGVHFLYFWVGSSGLFWQQTSFKKADLVTYGVAFYGIRSGGRAEDHTEASMRSNMKSFASAASPGAKVQGTSEARRIWWGQEDACYMRHLITTHISHNYCDQSFLYAKKFPDPLLLWCLLSVSLMCPFI